MLHKVDVEQSANDSQKFQHIVKLQICFEVSHKFTRLYSRGCTNSYDLWRRPWIGFTCCGAIEIIVVLLLSLLLKSKAFGS